MTWMDWLGVTALWLACSLAVVIAWWLGPEDATPPEVPRPAPPAPRPAWKWCLLVAGGPVTILWSLVRRGIH